MWRDDDHFHAPRDQVLNVGQLSRRIALAEQNLDLVASFRERVPESGLVLDPPRLFPRRQNDTNRTRQLGRRFLGADSVDTGELIGGPVTGVDDGLDHVFLVHGDDLRGRSRHVDDAVVVGRRRFRRLVVEEGNRRRDGVRHQRAHVLEHRHRLLAVDDVLHRRHLGILPGDHVARDVRVRPEGVGNGPCRAVVRRQDEYVTLVFRRRRRQVRLCQALGRVEVPFRRHLPQNLGHLLSRQLGLVLQGHRFVGVDDVERPIGDLRLQHVPRPLEEQEGVVVRCRARVQVQRVVRPRGVVHQVLRLGLAHRHAVECHVVVNRLRLPDQPVVADDPHPGVPRCFRSRCRRRRVVWRDDDHFHAPRDQVLNVGQLSRRIALAEQNLDLVASFRERVPESGLVLDPPRLFPRRQDHADAEFGRFYRFFCGGRRFFGRFNFLRRFGRWCVRGASREGEYG